MPMINPVCFTGDRLKQLEFAFNQRSIDFHHRQSGPEDGYMKSVFMFNGNLVVIADSLHYKGRVNFVFYDWIPFSEDVVITSAFNSSVFTICIGAQTYAGEFNVCLYPLKSNKPDLASFSDSATSLLPSIVESFYKMGCNTSDLERKSGLEISSHQKIEWNRQMSHAGFSRCIKK